MSNMKKLLGFRQLSLNCDTPQSPPRRRSLKKQFSEDKSHINEWSSRDLGIQISLNERHFTNSFIKHAWVDPIESIKNEPVIIKKCGENRRISSGKLMRKGSLGSDSLSTSKQEYSGRLRRSFKNTEEKPNLRIFLAQNSKEYDTIGKEEKTNEQPKLIKSLTTGLVNTDKNYFKMRKSSKTKSLNSPDVTCQESNPIIKNEMTKSASETQETLPENSIVNNNYVKPIASVIISPAASKREMFQKRTNSAFNATVCINDTPKPRRPLIRSSSAPCKPEHLRSKLIFQKHKKPFKNIQLKNTKKSDDADNLRNQKDVDKNGTVQINEVITMVSLVSPAGSDGEEEVVEDNKIKTKNVDLEKISPEPKPTPKIVSLKKAVKTVSFQQSSIHAIRSFSASFPARRASVSAAMMLGNSLNASTTQVAKTQEKRTTDSIIPDDDERMPKRRLVRNNTEDADTASFDHIEEPQDNSQIPTPSTNANLELADSVKNKNQSNLDIEKKEIQIDEPEAKIKETEKEVIVNPDLKSPKEKQCWSMYCKMTEKGINVSFDTILRGMLTPTEYRLSKKHMLAVSETEPPKST